MNGDILTDGQVFAGFELMEGTWMTSSKKDALQSAIAACGCQREKLRSFAAEIVASLSELPSSGDSDPLDIFVAELVLSAADSKTRKKSPFLLL